MPDVVRLFPTHLVPVDPDHPCDRCSHPMRRHVGPELGSWCNIARQSMANHHRAPACFCDGYVKKP